MENEVMMEGCKKDVAEVLQLFEKAHELGQQKGWREVTAEHRLLGNPGFIRRMKDGRVPARSMISARNKLRKFIQDHERKRA